MKVYTLLLSLSLMSVLLMATPQSDIQKLSGYYVRLDNEYHSAVLLDADFAHPGRLYEQTVLSVPATVTLTGPSMGGEPVAIVYSVVALGNKAFYNAPNATAVTFAADSRVSRIETEALANMPKMSGKLVLPASLEALAVSSILLPNITEIEFLGTTPPTCETQNGYLPWTSASGSTGRNIHISVPDGAWETYKAAAGIGDYFSCFRGDTPTGITGQENASAKACKIMRNGQLLIIRNGVEYDVQGNVIGK